MFHLLGVCYLGHKVRSRCTEGFQHWSGLSVEEWHSVRHFIVDFIFNVQLWKKGGKSNSLNTQRSRKDQDPNISSWYQKLRHHRSRIALSWVSGSKPFLKHNVVTMETAWSLKLADNETDELFRIHIGIVSAFSRGTNMEIVLHGQTFPVVSVSY